MRKQVYCGTLQKLPVLLLAGLLQAGPALHAADSTAKPTFTKDIAPILYSKCVQCHRAGDIAPMQLQTYKDVRPWAKSIQEQVSKRAMPPWFADPDHGKFRNDRHLTDGEIKLISAWVAAGAPEGNPKDLPPLPAMAQGWSFERPPDLVIEMPLEVKIPAEGQLDMMNYYAPVPFKTEQWVEAVELRPGNRQVVHHSIVNVVTLPPGLTQEQLTSGKKYGGLGWKLIGQAPGKGAERHTDGVAKRIAPGSYFEFNMHYTPTGKPETDRSLLGLWFAKGPIHHEVVTRPAMEQTLLGGKVVSRMQIPKIPAGDPNWAIDGQMTVKDDITLYSLSPHMHFRGHDMKYTVRFPDGHEEVLLNVPHYDFEWQLNYEFDKPVKIPAGSTFIVNGHFDNSKGNLKNPDPTADVVWGQQSWNEMFIPWAEWTVDKQDLTKMTKEEIDKMRNAQRVRDPEVADKTDKKN
jgi:hypothetical protein